MDLAKTGGELSAYLQDTIQLGTRVTADLGLRVDHYRLVTSATHASPRVNLAFTVAEDSTLHASYSRFFVPPPIEGVLSSSAGLTSFISEVGRALPPLAPAVEDQAEIGLSQGLGPASLALTGYYRATDNPMHTTVWPDARIYSYASFDRETAYGFEAAADLPGLSHLGITGYANYALARVNFFNPVVGGFVTETGHFDNTVRFLAPMDQTHTVSAGATYRHAGTGLWTGGAVEYGSGTPMGHGGGSHEHDAGDHADDDTGHEAMTRVPSHITARLSFGLDLLRGQNRRPRLSVRLDVENLTNRVYLVAQESEFSPAQFSIPRLVSATLRVEF